MHFSTLKITFFNLYERLDEYFDNKLWNEPKAKHNLESYKDDLMQELALKLWKNCSRSVYNQYSEEAFIWLKAESVWISFIRKLYRDIKYKSDIPIASLEETHEASDHLIGFETRDILAHIENTLSENEIKLLEYRSQGYTYEQIAYLMSYRSSNAAKTKFNRIKNIIIRRFPDLSDF